MDRALTTDEMIERARYCADYGIFTAAENGKSVGFAEMAERLQSLQAKHDEPRIVEQVTAILKRQRANRYAEEAIAPSELIDEEDAREIINAILSGAGNVR